MNVFILSTDPKEAASYLCDSHSVKMILEATQLLSNAVLHYGGISPYRPTHESHPCSIWARASRGNWLWLKEHAIAIGHEYTRRYGRIHACEHTISILTLQQIIIPAGNRTPFVQVVPDKYKDKDPVVAYRNYYRGEKRDIAEWKKLGNKPEWF